MSTSFLSPASFDSYKAANTGYSARQNSSAYIPQNLYARLPRCLRVLLVHRHGFNRIIVYSVVYKPYSYTLTAKLRRKTPLFSRAQPLKTRPGESLVLEIIILSTPAIACGTYAFMRAISPSVKKPWVALTDLSHISVRVFITPSVLFLTTKIPVILHKQAGFLHIIQSKICRKSIAGRFDALQVAKITVKINLNWHFKRLSTDISTKARYFFKNSP